MLDEVKKMPIYKKAMEIVDITCAIADTINQENDLLEVAQQMKGNSYILGAKIAGAEGGGLYMLQMENAVLIKMAARELQAQTSLCKMENLSEERYLNLLRQKIEEFRLLFLDWIAGFDPDDNINDGWGLFETEGGNVDDDDFDIGDLDDLEDL